MSLQRYRDCFLCCDWDIIGLSDAVHLKNKIKNEPTSWTVQKRNSRFPLNHLIKLSENIKSTFTENCAFNKLKRKFLQKIKAENKVLEEHIVSIIGFLQLRFLKIEYYIQCYSLFSIPSDWRPLSGASTGLHTPLYPPLCSGNELHCIAQIDRFSYRLLTCHSGITKIHHTPYLLLSKRRILISRYDDCWIFLRT